MSLKLETESETKELFETVIETKSLTILCLTLSYPWNVIFKLFRSDDQTRPDPDQTGTVIIELAC